MKIFKKTIIFLLSAVIFLSGFALPSMGSRKAYARDFNEGEVLEIGIGNDEVREFEIDESFYFTDFSSDSDVEVKVWFPDGSVACDWTKTDTVQKFGLPGLYAFQFRTTEPRTYSNFYHLVIKKSAFSIEIEDVYIPYALIGSSFTLPKAGVFDSAGSRVQDADVRVLDFRGNVVEVVGGKFSSPVSTAVSFFVEYSFTMNGIIIAREFIEVGFVSELPLVLSNLSLSFGKQKGQIDYATTFDIFRDYDISSAVVLDSNGNSVPSKISLTIYNSSKGKYLSSTGWTIVDDSESIAINSRTPKFFIDNIDDFLTNGISENGSTYIFTYTAVTALGNIVKTISKDSVFNDDIFSINFLGHVPSMIDVVVNGVQNSEETQTTVIPNFEIVFDSNYHKEAILECLEFSTEMTKSTDSSSFLSTAYDATNNNFTLKHYKEIASSTSFYISFYINYNIKHSSFQALRNQDFSKVTVNVISYNGNSYNKVSGEDTWVYKNSEDVEYKIKKNFSKYDLYLGDSSEVYTEDISIKYSDFSQIVYAGYTLFYNSSMGYWSTNSTTSNDMSRSLKLNADETFDFDFYHTQNQSNGVPLQGKIRLSMSTKTITLNDIDVNDVKPNNIKIGDYQAYYNASSGGTEVLLPSASASFYYTVVGTSFDTLNKYCFDVSISGGLFEGTGHLPGDKVVFNDEATYTITYTAKSLFGGTRSKSFEIVIGSSSSDASAFSEMRTFSPDVSSGVIDVSDEIENVFAINAKGEIFTPKLTFDNGFVTNFEIVGEWSAITFVRRGATTGQSVLFKTFYADGEVVAILPCEFVYNEDTKFAANLPSKNGTKEVVVGDFIYFGDANISFERISGSVIVKDRSIAFMTSGEYILTLVGSEIFYKIKVSNGADMAIDFVYKQSPVAEKGVDLDVVYAFLPNFFGYKLSITLISSKGDAVSVSKYADIDRVDAFVLNFNTVFEGISKTAVQTFISGSLIKPTITISSRNEDVVFSGESVVYELKTPLAFDQFGNKLSNIDTAVFDPNGKQLEIKDGKIVVALAGEYVVYYRAVDSDGNENVLRVSFVSNYAEIADEGDSLAWWEILLISLGSVIGAGVIGFVIYIIIKRTHGKNKFFSNRKKNKRKQKNSKVVRISIAQFKDDRTWFVKKNERMIAKCKSKEEAIEKAREIAGKDVEIKVYAKSGRLIDSIK